MKKVNPSFVFLKHLYALKIFGEKMRIKISHFKFGYEKAFQVVVLICLFLSAMNFFNRYYYFLFTSFLLLPTVPKQKVRFNNSTIFLLLLGVSMIIFDPVSQGSFLSMIRTMTYVCSYTLGISFIQSQEPIQKLETRYIQIISLLAGGTLLHYAMNMVHNLGSNSRAYIEDIWTGGHWNATGQASLACMAIGGVAAILFSDARLKWKLLAGTASILILAYNILVLAGRTILLLMLLTFFIAFCHQSYVMNKKLLKNVLSVAAVAAILVFIYQADLLGVKTAFEGSNFYERFFGDYAIDFFAEDPRIGRKLMHLQQMADYPWGGYKLNRIAGGYAHDLYLDTYSMSGILGFVVIVCYMIASIVRLVKVLQSKTLAFATKQVTLCVYVAINILFWIEPIIQGMPWLFASYCAIDGMATYLISSEKGRIPLALNVKQQKKKVM